MPKAQRLAEFALHEAHAAAHQVRVMQQAAGAFGSHAMRAGEALERLRDKLGPDHFRMWLAANPEVSREMAEAFVSFSRNGWAAGTGDMRTLLEAITLRSIV